MFYVLNVSADRSWVLTPEGVRSAADARGKIQWQAQGGEDPASYRVCTYDGRRNRFVSKPADQIAQPPGALVADQLCTWAPDRGPYTAEAFAAFCARLKYRPDDGDSIRTALNTEMLVAVGPMGRDVAAFANPLDALEFFEVLKPALRGGYRRPDGETLSYRRAAADAAQFATWAAAWAGNDQRHAEA